MFRTKCMAIRQPAGGLAVSTPLSPRLDAPRQNTLSSLTRPFLPPSLHPKPQPKRPAGGRGGVRDVPGGDQGGQHALPLRRPDQVRNACVHAYIHGVHFCE